MFWEREKILKVVGSADTRNWSKSADVCKRISEVRGAIDLKLRLELLHIFLVFLYEEICYTIPKKHPDFPREKNLRVHL
jgi:hypothetical protein